ncbi:prepilin-type N-terminal cleavage/methylation domain-containing protein [Salinicoccus kekensis]|nr:prepilin-type N-terminal cleavage/methylation domain-containing protein [Salinicoccus kekensis]
MVRHNGQLQGTSGFTMMEMMLTLAVVSIILLISVSALPDYDVLNTDDEISNISYFFKAAQTRTIYEESAHIVMMDHENNQLIARSSEGGDAYVYTLTACTLSANGLKRFMYIASGDTNAFGTVNLKCRGEDVRFVFQIQKGQFRIER